MEKCRLSYFLILFVCNNIASSQGNEDDLYSIKSAITDLVLDVSESKVLVQYFDGYVPQLWRFTRGSRPGLFVIINNSTGTAIDVTEDHIIVVAPENGSLRQQWSLNSNGRIVNAALDRNLDIIHASYVAGNYLIAQVNNGNDAQNFVLKEKGASCGLERKKEL